MHSARGDGKENSAAIPQSPQHGKAEAKYNDTPTKKLTRSPKPLTLLARMRTRPTRNIRMPPDAPRRAYSARVLPAQLTPLCATGSSSSSSSKAMGSTTHSPTFERGCVGRRRRRRRRRRRKTSRRACMGGHTRRAAGRAPSASQYPQHPHAVGNHAPRHQPRPPSRSVSPRHHGAHGVRDPSPRDPSPRDGRGAAITTSPLLRRDVEPTSAIASTHRRARLSSGWGAHLGALIDSAR